MYSDYLNKAAVARCSALQISASFSWQAEECRRERRNLRYVIECRPTIGGTLLMSSLIVKDR